MFVSLFQGKRFERESMANCRARERNNICIHTIVFSSCLIQSLIILNIGTCLCVFNQAEAVVKVDSTKEVLKMRRWVLAAASERYIAARAGMTGKETSTHFCRSVCWA